MIPYGGTYRSARTIYDPATNAPAASLTVNSVTLLVDGVATATAVAILKQSDGTALAVGSAIAEPRITASASVAGRPANARVRARASVTVGTATQDVYFDADSVSPQMTGDAVQADAVRTGGVALQPPGFPGGIPLLDANGNAPARVNDVRADVAYDASGLPAYVAPDNAGLAAVRATTDKLDPRIPGSGVIATAGDVGGAGDTFNFDDSQVTLG